MSSVENEKDRGNAVIAAFKEEIDERARSYADELRFDRNEGGVVCLVASSGFIADTIKHRFFDRLEALVRDHFGGGVSLRIDVKSETGAAPPSEAPAQTAPPVSAGDRGGAVTPSYTAPVAPAAADNTPPLVPAPLKKALPQNMDERFTFETFVPDKSTQFAYALAQAVAKNPGLPKNTPLFIYGPVGTGKTHLMQAIGLYAHFNTDSKVIYTTTDIFVEDFVAATQKGHDAILNFKKKYRKADFLLVDDIHNLKKNMAGSQEELFYVLEDYSKIKRQIIFTSDRPAKELKEVQERIQSRLGAGSQFSLSMPPFETRCAIVRRKLESTAVSIPNDIIEFMCKNINSNLRDLVGALNDLVHYAELVMEPLTLEVAQTHIRGRITAVAQTNISVEKIQKIVADHFSLKVKDFKDKNKSHSIARPRQIAMYLARELTESSSTEIGDAFARDHATVLAAVKKIENAVIQDPSLETAIQELTRTIKESGIE